MNGNALHILNTTHNAILAAEKNENSAREREQNENLEEPFVDIYPCSCGHCSECGVNAVVTPEEERRWAQEDVEEATRWEKIDGEWFKVW
jgi:hypothetical protein